MSAEQSHGELERVAMRLIKGRSKAKKSPIFSLLHRDYPKADTGSQLPDLELPESVNILMNRQDLWLVADGNEFTPSLLVKAFFVHRGRGYEKEKTFSVFIADQKRKIAGKWGIIPLQAWNKQKNQFWDKRFAKAIFENVCLCLNSNDPHLNKISYAIREDITLFEMKRLYAEGIRGLSNSINGLKSVNRVRNDDNDRERFSDW